MPHPNPHEPGAVLGPVKTWPGEGGDDGGASATASLDWACARLPKQSAGRDERKATIEPEKVCSVR
jgi:hypothetical protein